MARRFWLGVIVTLAAGFSSTATRAVPQAQPQPEYGPAKGTLIIVGGGSTDNTGIMEKFIELAGGLDAHFVIIPTAGGNKEADGKTKVYGEEATIASWKKRGLKNVRMLHTHDPKIADNRGLRQGAQGSQRSMVQRWKAMEHR